MRKFSVISLDGGALLYANEMFDITLVVLFRNNDTIVVILVGFVKCV